MKVYFMTSPRSKSDLNENIKTIYETIQRMGHTHTTDFIVNVNVDTFYDSDIAKFHKNTLLDLKKADVCIFETSEHSLAVGQLLTKAIELGKPIIALHTRGNAPFFLTGSDDDKVQIVEYSLNNLEKQLQLSLDYAADQQDTRFNFFISPKHQHYLDWISKTRKVPRAVFLRRLIEREMEKDEEYQN